MLVETFIDSSSCFSFLCLEEGRSFWSEKPNSGLKDEKMEVGSVNHMLENWWWTNREKLNSDQEKRQLVFSRYFILFFFCHCDKIYLMCKIRREGHLAHSQCCVNTTMTLFRNLFVPPKGNLVTMRQSLPIPPALQRPATTNLLLVCVDLPYFYYFT